MIEIRNEYIPSKKGVAFHSSSARTKLLVGGMGSGKTRMAVEEVNQLCLEHPGIKILVLRKTMPSLRESTMNEFVTIVPDEVGKMDRKFDNFNYTNGARILFRGLDEPAKMKSIEFAVILMDEADEFEQNDFKILDTRIRLLNKENPLKPFPLHIIMVLNPVDEDHWIYKLAQNKEELEKAGGYLELHLSTHENEHNLPPGYIQRLISTLTAAEQDMLIHGNWGTIIRGSPVFADIFSRELHIYNMKYMEGFRIQRGWDFGFNRPACVVRIKDFAGRKNIYYENLGEKEYLDIFAQRVIQDCERMFGKNATFEDYCDPRGNDKKDSGQTSVEILNDLDIFPVGERGMKAYVEPGVKCVRHELSTLIQTIPLLTISERCPILVTGFSGKYVREDSGEVKKDGYYEHLMDANRAIAYQDKSNSMVREAMSSRKTKRQPRNKYTGY